MKFIAAIFFVLFTITGHAQSADTALAGQEILTSVQQMPEFNGNLQAYLAKNLVLPDAPCAKDAADSKFLVKFIVDKAGKPRRPEILRGWGQPCDAAILNLINNMPAWKPGKQNGQLVNVVYTLPIIIHVDQ